MLSILVVVFFLINELQFHLIVIFNWDYPGEDRLRDPKLERVLFEELARILGCSKEAGTFVEYE